MGYKYGHGMFFVSFTLRKAKKIIRIRPKTKKENGKWMQIRVTEG